MEIYEKLLLESAPPTSAKNLTYNFQLGELGISSRRELFDFQFTDGEKIAVPDAGHSLRSITRRDNAPPNGKAVYDDNGRTTTTLIHSVV